MIGWIMITLVTQWFVIFFEAKEVCAELINQGELTGLSRIIITIYYTTLVLCCSYALIAIIAILDLDAKFKERQKMVQSLEDFTYENGSKRN